MPTDSETLTSLFHSHVVNMRYLGKVLEIFEKEKNYSHVKCILEREIFLRSAKHVFNENIRDSPESFDAAVVANLLNLTFAPTPMLTLLEDGKLKIKPEGLFADSSIE